MDISKNTAKMLPTMPPELLSRICAHVSSKETLKSIAMCSKQFYDIAIPYLYQSLDLQEDGSPEDSRPDRFHLKHLIELFLRRPKLASYVRRMSLRPVFTDSWTRQPEKVDIETARQFPLHADIKTAIRNASHSEEEEAKWLKDCMNDPNSPEGCDDPLLGVLLTTLTRLEALDLEFPIFPTYVTRTFERSAKREPPFDVTPCLEHLREICWVHDDNKYGGHLCAPFFQLRSLRGIFMHRIGSSDREADKDMKVLESGSSVAEHVELHDVRLNPEDTEHILRVPKALKTFIYEIGWGHLSYCDVSFPALRDGLEHQKDTLEDLWLDYGHDGIDHMNEDTTPLASFRDFPNLKRLRIATVFVFGDHSRSGMADESPTATEENTLLDLLPSKLETLHLTHGDDQISGLVCAALKFLLLRKEDSNALASLKSIAVEMSLRSSRNMAVLLQRSSESRNASVFH